MPHDRNISEIDHRDRAEPQPRRTSNTAPISANSASFFGGAFGGPSPWSPFSGTPGGAPGQAASSGSSMLSSLGGTPIGANPGSRSSSTDPWARAQTSWNRARHAFEQPAGSTAGGSIGLGGSSASILSPSLQQPLGLPNSPFGAPTPFGPNSNSGILSGLNKDNNGRGL